jgi:pimeloyl-ACP methyl ester carboxylesterase
MPTLQLGQYDVTYAVEGEGFPLVLIPDTHGTIAHWSGPMPLLGELCRVIAYEFRLQPSMSASIETILALLDTLAIPRAYLAGYGGGAQSALHCAQYVPERLEALLLVGMDSITPPPPWPSSRMAADPGRPRQLSTLDVPTCLLAGQATPEHLRYATRLAMQLPRGVSIPLPDTSTEPHRNQPLRLGHAMLDFLMQCERRRNLVRGASFLL